MTQDIGHTGLHDCYVWMTLGQLLSQKKPEFAIYLLFCRYLKSENLYISDVGFRISRVYRIVVRSSELRRPLHMGHMENMHDKIQTLCIKCKLEL